MDLDEVRRKRIKLFDPRNNTTTEASASASPIPDQPNTTDDEKYARDLQAAWERGEHHSHQTQDASPTGFSPNTQNMSEDERLARELHAAFERGKSIPEEPLNGAPGAWRPSTPPNQNEALHPLPPRDTEAPHSGLFKTSNDIAEDERLARELQAELEAEDDNYPEDEEPEPLHPYPPQHPFATEHPFPPTKRGARHGPVHTTTPIKAEELDSSAEANAVRELATITMPVKCGICGNTHDLDQDKLVKMFESMVECSGKPINIVAECGACPGKTCYGCGAALTASSISFGSTACNGTHLTWHCDRGRLALIWFLLCGYDSKATHNKPQHIVRDTTKQDEANHDTRHRRRRDKFANTGIGYADDYEDEYDYDSEDIDPPYDVLQQPAVPMSGTGWMYGGGKTLGPRQRRKQKESPVRVDPGDELAAQIMAAVAAMLPNSREQLVPTEFDVSPPANLESLLQRSSILDKAAELLYNDSLEDVGRRSRLYETLLAFVRALVSNGEVIMPTLYEGRRINKAGHDLLKVSYGLPTRMKDERAESSMPLAECMKNLAKQSTAMLKTVQANQSRFEAEEDQQILILCTNITDCAEHILALAPSYITKSKDPTPPEQDKSSWQQDVNVLPVAEELILQNHYFANEARTLLNVTNPPKRRLAHIYKEIVTLQTSLPPGIFIRYGESRPDVMKIVIAGPKGTPYENGLFEFDLICELDYPNVAPKMQFKTTGGGTVGFNPNLYPDGKICLSLLGTWEGEKWKPGQSTLLQVFVSIQAMIFCDEPWCNEPGREHDRGREVSKIHSRSLYPSTVKYGMLEWLENKRSRLPVQMCRGRRLDDAQDETVGKIASVEETDIWADVAKKHFEVNADDIVKTVCEWIKDKPPQMPQKSKRSHKKKAFGFLGTGWGGRTLGEGSENSDKGPKAQFQPSELDLLSGLVPKLKRLLEELESFKGLRAWDYYEEIDPEEEEEDL